MSRKPSTLKQLNEHIKRQHPTVEFVTLYRNMGFAAAAICLVVLLGIAQIKTTTTLTIALKISVFSASVALPLWLLLGIIYEYYIALGERSYVHLQTLFARSFLILVVLVGSAGLIGATCGVIYFLDPAAMWLFVLLVSAVAFCQVWFHTKLADWWYGPDGPGSTKGSPPGPRKGH